MAIAHQLQVSEDGQVTLPFDVLQRLGLDHGGIISLVETDGGVLLASEEMIAIAALNRMGEEIAAAGLSLDDLIESGREERARISQERAHNIDA